MRRGRWLLVLAAWCGLAGDVEAVELFESQTGRFRVLLPGEPSVETHSRRTLLGRVTDARYELASDGTFWAVETHDIPRAAALLLPARVILDRARQGFLADRDRREIERTDTERRGHPAQRIRYVRRDDPEWPRVALLVLAGNRIYIVIGEDSPRTRETLPPERFLASFDFWEEDAQPPGPAKPEPEVR